MLELRASSADNDASLLRERLDADGYLLIRGLVDVQLVEQLGAATLAILRDQDLLDRGDDAIAKFRATRTTYYSAVQRVEAFHALAHDEGLRRVVRALLGDDAFVHPRKLLRALWPGVPELTTMPHQDLQYIRGTPNTVTSWLPLRACLAGKGALRVLTGSHGQGLVKNVPSPGFAGSRADVDDDDPRWASADFRPGDVLLFGSTTVHGATPNTSGRVRLSADYRHQSASEPIAAAELKPAGYPGVPDWPELLDDVIWPYDRWLSVPPDLEIVDAAPDAPRSPPATGRFAKSRD
jgi:hypothetical protein